LFKYSLKKELPTMMKIYMTIAAAALALPFATAAFSDGHENPFAANLAARQGQMRLQAFNIGVLVGMARGDAEYDAAAAQTAANNLAAISQMDGRAYWPEGSDNGALGDATRALPAIWQDMAGFGEAWGALGTAATAMDAVAGDGLAALQGAIGPLGSSCGACHRNYQQSDD
jgi:cytochrome c556